MIVTLKAKLVQQFYLLALGEVKLNRVYWFLLQPGLTQPGPQYKIKLYHFVNTV